MINPLSAEEQKEIHESVVDNTRKNSPPSGDRHGILLMGLSGSGKSVLAPHLLGELNTRGDSDYALVDFDDYATGYPGYLKSIREDPLETTHQVITELAPVLVGALKEIAGRSNFIHNHIFNNGEQAQDFLRMFRESQVSRTSLIVISEPLTISEVGLGFRNDPKSILEGRTHYIPPGVSPYLQEGMVDGLNAIDTPKSRHLYDEALFVSRNGEILAHKYPSGPSSHPELPLGQVYQAAQASRTFGRSEVSELLRQVDVIESRPGAGPPWSQAPPWADDIRRAINALPRASGETSRSGANSAAVDLFSAVRSTSQRPSPAARPTAAKHVVSPSLLGTRGAPTRSARR